MLVNKNKATISLLTESRNKEKELELENQLLLITMHITQV